MFFRSAQVLERPGRRSGGRTCCEFSAGELRGGKEFVEGFFLCDTP